MCKDSAFVFALATNRNVFAPNRKIVDSNKVFGWENCMLTILSLLIHNFLESQVVLTSP